MVLPTTPQTCGCSTPTAIGSSRLLLDGRPLGCDTFVAYPPTTPPGVVLFGKNSDRPEGEPQSIRSYPAGIYNTKEDVVLKCTYITIPQVSKTYAVLLSQIDWMWGAEMGANECGVIIGNEAVWTVEPDYKKEALLGMDLVRLGLERGGTAKEALEVITDLLEKYNQGGACAENDPSFTYHNSFLIVDANESYVLETAGQCWVAQRITSGSRNISNGLTIRTQFDFSSDGLKEYAKSKGYWKNTEEEFDFAKCFSSDGDVDDSPYSRQGCGARLLKQHENKNTLDFEAMVNILRTHDAGICMHGGFETTASMISELQHQQNGKEMEPWANSKHWMTGQPYPCKSEFILQKTKN